MSLPWWLIVIIVLETLPTFLVFGLSERPLIVTAIFGICYYFPALVALRYLWKTMSREDQPSIRK